MVRVPVLSELMAEVNPRVSTDGRSLTMALRFASSTLPSDRITWVTVGSASGMAAMASDTALDEQCVPGLAAVATEGEHHDHRQPGRGCDPQAQNVELPGQRRLLLGGAGQQTGDLSQLGAGAGGGHDHRAAAVGDRSVHERHVRLVARSQLGPARRPASLPAGTLSPVNADSSICSALAATMRPSAGT